MLSGEDCIFSRKAVQSLMKTSVPATSSNLLLKCVLHCRVPPHPNLTCAEPLHHHPSPPHRASWEQFLQAGREAVSQARVLILPPIKLNSQFLCFLFLFFSVDIIYQTLFPLGLKQPKKLGCFFGKKVHSGGKKNLSSKYIILEL